MRLVRLGLLGQLPQASLIPALFAILAFAIVPLAIAEPNVLTSDELAEGWVLLYDGESDFGWEHHGDARWSARRGQIRASAGGNGWLGTAVPFGDFELKLQFKTAADGNSGVFLRSAQEGEPHKTGYELQIFDDQPFGYNTGGLVFYAFADTEAKIDADQWNQYEIRCEGPRFVIRLNGESVLDVQNALHPMGVIGLQYNEGKPIAFRDIKLRPLGLEAMFNGKNFDGWQTVDHPTREEADPKWTVKEEMIHVESGPGELESVEQYGDFVMQLDVRTNPDGPEHHPNSGVFFRKERGVYGLGYESQIRNEFQHGDVALPFDYGTGAIYRRVSARKIVAKDGEFFHKTIVVSGRRMAVWVNGYQVTSWADTRPEGGNGRVQYRAEPGSIALQAHDPTTNLDFKNLRIVELADR